MTPTRGIVASAGMSNVLSDDKRQQILALGRLGWPLRRIEQATGVRRETASAYLKAAGIYVRPPGGWGRPDDVTLNLERRSLQRPLGCICRA